MKWNDNKYLQIFIADSHVIWKFQGSTFLLMWSSKLHFYALATTANAIAIVFTVYSQLLNCIRRNIRSNWVILWGTYQRQSDVAVLFEPWFIRISHSGAMSKEKTWNLESRSKESSVSHELLAHLNKNLYSDTGRTIYNWQCWMVRSLRSIKVGIHGLSDDTMV